jgi:hypothetical protein
MANHYKKRRLEMHLSLTQLARMVGYTNLSKGYRRIDEFERTGGCHPILFAKLTAALGIDERTRNRLEYEDYKEWLATPANPPTPYMLRPGLRGCLGLAPEATTVAEMEEYAAGYAKRHRTNVCLVLNKRIYVRFTEDGSLRDIVEVQPPENPRGS